MEQHCKPATLCLPFYESVGSDIAYLASLGMTYGVQRRLTLTDAEFLTTSLRVVLLLWNAHLSRAEEHRPGLFEDLWNLTWLNLHLDFLRSLYWRWSGFSWSLCFWWRNGAIVSQLLFAASISIYVNILVKEAAQLFWKKARMWPANSMKWLLSWPLNHVVSFSFTR